MRPLTARQLEVARLIAEGMTNDEIADRLAISPRTVKQTSDVIRLKLGVAHRRQIPQAMKVQGIA